MTTGAFSRNVGKVIFGLKLVTEEMETVISNKKGPADGWHYPNNGIVAS